MAEWKLSKFVSPAIGWIYSEARGKMETHYKDLKKEYLTSQNSMNYSRDLTPQEKDNLFKEAYSNIALFERLVYEAKQNSRKRR